MPKFDLIGCSKSSGLGMVFLIDASKIATVVQGTATGEENSVANFTLAAPTDKFTEWVLNGNHVEVVKTSAGAKTKKATASINIALKEILNATDDGVELLKEITRACGYAAVVFPNDGLPYYIGASGTADADKTFMGNVHLQYSEDTGTTGAADTDMQSGSIVLSRENELTHRVFRPLTPNLAANFVANFV